uniref:HTH gntR-type domain-containing protein n=1 Tax=uncultured bacterium fosmid pJB148G3 TaxID=1478052 RepID=A0A0H3U8N0_9BACT|nr:hypothetical protein [uncultured bacterium fosmid pJB148G3]
MMPKGSFIPQYKKIYNDLKRQIIEEQYTIGEQLPCERELCNIYSVERITVRKALSLLEEEGLIQKHPGIGSFVGNVHEINMLNKDSKTILFLMQKSMNDIQSNSTAFNAQLFFPMEQVCRDNGYSLLYLGYNVGDNIIEFIQRYQIAGVFLVSTLPEDAFAQVIKTKIPAICINHIHEKFLSIMPDNAKGIKIAMEYLISCGHRKIAFLGGSIGATNAEERKESYILSGYTNELQNRYSRVMQGRWTYDSGVQAMKQLLEEESPENYPTAVIAASDMMAIGCMDAIRAAGLKVPENISVVGFDDIDMSRFCTPALTTIKTDSVTMARVAVEHMLAHLNGNTQFDVYTLRLPINLSVRNSVKTI